MINAVLIQKNLQLYQLLKQFSLHFNEKVTIKKHETIKKEIFTQLTFTCSKSTIETIAIGVKYVQI